MELATTVFLGPCTLAERAAPGTGLASYALPIGAIEPWSNVAFHYPHLSTIDGVSLYLKIVFI